MGAPPRHLYTLEIRPSRDAAEHFTWAIRDHGKLCRASYQPQRSKEQAQEIAEAELARLLERDGVSATLAA